jgi:hypothetical protein
MNEVKKKFGVDAALVRILGGVAVIDPAFNDDSGLIILQNAAQQKTLNGGAGQTAVPTSGGTVVLTAAGAGAYTLAAPTAGQLTVSMVPPTNAEVLAGGQDGTRITLISATAQAHVVTAPANKIKGTGATLTFGAAIGNSVILEAYNGVWMPVSLIGVTVA